MPEMPKEPDPQIAEDARRLAAGGADRETVMFFLREKGCDKIDSIKVMRALYGMSMPEAKDAVDHSATWSDRYESDLQFRELAWQAFRDIAAESALDPNALKIEFAGPEDERDES